MIDHTRKRHRGISFVALDSEVVRLAAAGKASQVRISGYRAASLLSNGLTLSEGLRIAESHAQNVAEVLRGLGVSSSSVSVKWKTDAEPANGVTDPRIAGLRLS